MSKFKADFPLQRAHLFYSIPTDIETENELRLCHINVSQIKIFMKICKKI